MSQGLTLFIGIFLILLLAAVLVFIIYWQGLSNAVFMYCFKRGSEDHWKRGKCSDTSNKNLFRMWETGLAWAEENKDCMTEIETYNENTRLAAQYFDFGKEKAVIIVPGLNETCMYSYYYAETWKKAGYNCLLIDNRTVGNSEGEYNSIGYNESGDLLHWAELLKLRCKMQTIVFHGISMGAVTGLLAINFPNCPSYITGIVCDEAYYQFLDFLKKFMIKKRYNLVAYNTVLKKIYRMSGANPRAVAPVNFVDRLDIPVLFLAGKNDDIVSESETQAMFDKYGTSCGGDRKELVWFENGEHGFIRLCNTEKYDNEINSFIQKYSL